jgi:hypothetical protein
MALCFAGFRETDEIAQPERGRGSAHVAGR